jgi:3-methyladenine DNA glycosylase AlkC
MEQIALDMKQLWANQFPDLTHHAAVFDGVEGLVRRMRVGGAVLWRQTGEWAFLEGIRWESDTARGWAAMAIGAAENLPLGRRLDLVRPYADDPHFAVREWAWLSLRAHVVAATHEALEALVPWVHEDSPRLRRFAVESLRPRGVWSIHIPLLKIEPWLASHLLEVLKADRERYVQDSVANWLNDASKSQPEWVRSLCASWRTGRHESATERICRRALRTIGD